MMREKDEIRRGLLEMLSTEGTIFLATVSAVNEEEFTCTVMQKEGVNYYDVRLRSVINPDLNGMVFIPKIGSYVLVCRIGESNELFVCQYSEINKIIFSNENMNFLLDNESVKADVNGTAIGIQKTRLMVENVENNIRLRLEDKRMELEVNDNTIDISDSAILFNGGGNGGLIKINELTNKLNDLIGIFNSHTHNIGIISGSGKKTIPQGVVDIFIADTPTDIVPAPDNKCSEFTPSDYENTNIKH